VVGSCDCGDEPLGSSTIALVKAREMPCLEFAGFRRPVNLEVLLFDNVS
jgi:hypothetical protein